jgi:histidine triad (HIT) family protein
MKCEFCNEKEFENRTVFENKTVRAFLTKTPIVPGHTLIIPKRHAETIFDLTDLELANLFAVTKKITNALTASCGAKGFHYALNQGKFAGQTVPHMHLHIVPRKEGDSGIVDYEPRKFLYRPDSRAESPQQELSQTAMLIKKSL